MRTFIAIEIPGEIKDFLAKIQERLKKTDADVKWVDPANIHLTLKFIGEINEEKLDKIKGLIPEIAIKRNAFLAKISSFGAFPKISSPRVIWAGIDDKNHEIKQIAHDLEEAALSIDIPKENRPFSSHLTLGRTKSNSGQDKLVTELKNVSDNKGMIKSEFTVAKITLFKSNLTPQGPIYEALQQASLRTI